MENISNIITTRYGSLLINLAEALIILLIGWFVINKICKIALKMMRKSSQDDIVLEFINTVISILLKAVLVIVCLTHLGVTTTSLIAVLTTAGAAIALGLKDSLSEVVDGIQIIFAKPFQKGDLIEVNGVKGQIMEIQLMYTFLTTLDNKRVVIPNSQMANNVIVNYSHESTRRADFKVDVSYDSDIEHVREIIYNVLKEHPQAIMNPEPFIKVEEYKDSSISFIVRVWTKTVYYDNFMHDVLEKIKVAFDKENIVIPYQQLDVHIKKEA